jgi:predicted deacetylase
VCVVLHDVTPARWDGCTRVLRQLRLLAEQAGVELPVTLLVVPALQGDPTPTAAPSRYLRWLHGMARAGHELALHGPPARAWASGLMRRRPGERSSAGDDASSALPHEEALQELARARSWAQAHGLRVHGFMAPAWLPDAASGVAASAAGFAYTCTPTRVVALPEGQALSAPRLVFGARLRWRTAWSLLWNSARAWQARHAPVLRLELHPGDCDSPAVRRCWTRVLARALQDRQPLRLQELAALARRAGTPPAQGWP